MYYCMAVFDLLSEKTIEECCRIVRPAFKGQQDSHAAMHCVRDKIGLDPDGRQGSVAWLGLRKIFARRASDLSRPLDKASRRRLHWLADTCRALAHR